MNIRRILFAAIAMLSAMHVQAQTSQDLSAASETDNELLQLEHELSQLSETRPSATKQARIPANVGACPTFRDGTVTFNPRGAQRRVRLFLTPGALTKGGPLVLYWYGTFGQPTQAQSALGSSFAAIKAAGGIIAAPINANGGTFPWLGGGDADYRLADEIVACAVKNGVNPNRIHSLGFSAGGLFTTMLSFARSNYIASIATYSGGLQSSRPVSQDPNNKYNALILTGGSRDVVFGTNFPALSRALQSRLKSNGHSAIYCDHRTGHRIPSATYQSAVGQFFLDHPFGTNPSPYLNRLPAALARCTP